MYFGRLVTINNGDIYIVIKKNSTLEQVAKQLQEKDIIKSEDAFIKYAKVKGLKGSTEGGNFIIKPKTKLNNLIIRLIDGKSEFTVITIPEGYTLYQIAGKLEEINLVKKENMLKEKLNVLKANTKGEKTLTRYTIVHLRSNQNIIRIYIRFTTRSNIFTWKSVYRGCTLS